MAIPLLLHQQQTMKVLIDASAYNHAIHEKFIAADTNVQLFCQSHASSAQNYICQDAQYQIAANSAIALLTYLWHCSPCEKLVVIVTDDTVPCAEKILRAIGAQSVCLLSASGLVPSKQLPVTDFALLFQQAPANFLVLTADTQIVAASDGYLHATMTKREEIVNKMVFDVFPDNPLDANAGKY